jgi:FkbH-like protein
MEAIRLSKQKPQGQPLRIQLIANVEVKQLVIYLLAYLNRYQIAAEIETTPFGSLVACLSTGAAAKQSDFNIVMIDSDVAEIGCSLRLARFRKSIYDGSSTRVEIVTPLLSALRGFLSTHGGKSIVCGLPLWSPSVEYAPEGYPSKAMSDWHGLCGQISNICASFNSPFLSGSADSLFARDTSQEVWYLNNGEPLRSVSASGYALEISTVINNLQNLFSVTKKKLLITDLDNTFWSGIIGDDGVESVEFLDSKNGLIHSLYQKFLRLLSSEGVVLAVCSKNSPEVIEQAFEVLELPCPKDRFALISANWGAKSQNIKDICARLNLLPSSAVFVDDNDFELDEVSREIPELEFVKFPDAIDKLPEFLSRLRAYFCRLRIDDGAENRIKSYQTASERDVFSLETPSHNYQAYLKSLNMSLRINRVADRSNSRVLELINKTNQFNLNGRRLTATDYDNKLKNADVFSVSLEDKNMDFGIIGALVVDKIKNGYVFSTAVLSCRVFSRGIETAMFDSISKALLRRDTSSVISIDYVPTERNGPVASIVASLPEDQFGRRIIDVEKVHWPKFTGQILCDF